MQHRLIHSPSQSSISIILETIRKPWLIFESSTISANALITIFKNIFIECPKLEEFTISPNFSHINDLYNMELSKPVKIAYNLNDECQNPHAIEKTKVSLASHIFGKSRRNAFMYYVKNGHLEWERGH